MKRTVTTLSLLVLLSVAPEAKAGIWWEAGSLLHGWQEAWYWLVGVVG